MRNELLFEDEHFSFQPEFDPEADLEFPGFGSETGGFSWEIGTGGAKRAETGAQRNCRHRWLAEVERYPEVLRNRGLGCLFKELQRVDGRLPRCPGRTRRGVAVAVGRTVQCIGEQACQWPVAAASNIHIGHVESQQIPL